MFRQGRSITSCPDYFHLDKNAGRLVTVSEAVENTSGYPKQDLSAICWNAPYPKAICRPGCVGEWAGNSATVHMSHQLLMPSKDFPLAWRQGCDDTHLLSGPLPSHSYSTSCQPSSIARHTQTHAGTAPPIHCRRHPICQGWQTHGLKCLLPSVPHMLRLPFMTLADITGPNGQQDTLTWCTERRIHKSKVGVSLLSFRRSFLLGSGAGGSTWK